MSSIIKIHMYYQVHLTEKILCKRNCFLLDWQFHETTLSDGAKSFPGIFRTEVCPKELDGASSIHLSPAGPICQSLPFPILVHE